MAGMELMHLSELRLTKGNSDEKKDHDSRV